MKKIYIAGPYTKGDPVINVKTVIEVANELAAMGFAPYAPHLTHFWHLTYPRPYEFWFELHTAFLSCCDAVLRIPGESNGADKEVALAKNKNIPVFYSIAELRGHSFR